MKVLVVDDDIVVPMMIQMGFPEIEVIEASRAWEGLRFAADRRPDVIVLDQRLPDGDGLEVVRRLRSDVTAEQIPVVVLTAGHDPAAEVEVLRAGADMYLAKPCEPTALIAALEALVATDPELRRQRRRRAADLLEQGCRSDWLTIPALVVPVASRRSWWKKRALAPAG